MNAVAAAAAVCVALLAVVAAASPAAAYSVEGVIRLPRSVQDPSQRRVVLSGGRSAIPNSRGEFVIENLAAGTYLLEVQDLENVFPPVRIDISAKESGRVRASNPDTSERLAYPLVLRPLAPAQYFEVRVPYDWTAMLKNPMVMMMGFSLFLMVLMPKMMANMDPEELEQMRKGGLSSVLNAPPPSGTGTRAPAVAARQR